MTVKNITRIRNYFESFNKLNAEVLDSQFDLIGDYLNNQVSPTLDQISQGRVVGSVNPADANKFLQNVGDYSTRWGQIDNNSFDAGSITLNKLVKVNIGGVVCTGRDGIFKAISPTNGNQTLMSKNFDYPAWGKLDTHNIGDRVITGDNVADGTITSANLSEHLMATICTANSITGDKFKDNSITSLKISNQTLTADKLAPEVVGDFSTAVWSNIIPNEYLGDVNYILKDFGRYDAEILAMIKLINPKNTPPIPAQSSSVQNPPRMSLDVTLPLSKFKGDFIGPHIYGVVTSSTKIKPNSIDAIRVLLMMKGDYPIHKCVWRKNLHQILAKESIGLEHLTPDLRKKLLEGK